MIEQTGAGEVQLCFRWINTMDVPWCAALRQEFSQRAAAAPDIDPAKVHGRMEPVEKLLPDKTAPHAHAMLIGGRITKQRRVRWHPSSGRTSCERQYQRKPF